MNRKPKTVFQLDSPFTAVQWPQVSSMDQDTILELFCRILSTVGQYRLNHAIRSKGKREKKRKRKEAAAETEKKDALPLPPPPAIADSMVVGLSSITRILETSSQEPRPEEPTNSATVSDPATEEPEEPVSSDTAPLRKPTQKHGHFAAIFVLRSSQPPILHAHLPMLIATASLAHPSRPPTRLVQLPKGSDARICAALGLPRVSFLGLLEEAEPQARPLVELVRDCVPEIEVPWLKEARDPTYKPLKVNVIETSAPVATKKS